MGFYGNKWVENDFLNEITEELVNEAVKIKSTDDGDYVTNKKFKGTTIEISSAKEPYSEEKLAEISNAIEKDIKVLNKNYDKGLKPVFEKLLADCKNWNMECDSASKLMKMAKISTITYHYFSNTVRRFELFFNGGNKFFGGHTLIVELNVSDDNIIIKRNSLEG